MGTKSYLLLLVFSMISRLSDKCRRNGTRKPKNGVGSYKVFAIDFFKIFMNFGPQTAKIGPSYLSTVRKCCMLSQTEVTGTRAELNQTSRHVGK